MDNAADAFQAVAPGAATTNGYGTYGVTAAGVWTYTLDNTNAAVNALNELSPPLSDTFTVLSEDGTPQLVTITITGTQRRPDGCQRIADQAGDRGQRLQLRGAGEHL